MWKALTDSDGGKPPSTTTTSTSSPASTPTSGASAGGGGLTSSQVHLVLSPPFSGQYFICRLSVDGTGEPTRTFLFPGAPRNACFVSAGSRVFAIGGFRQESSKRNAEVIRGGLPPHRPTAHIAVYDMRKAAFRAGPSMLAAKHVTVAIAVRGRIYALSPQVPCEGSVDPIFEVLAPRDGSPAASVGDANLDDLVWSALPTPPFVIGAKVKAPSRSASLAEAATPPLVPIASYAVSGSTILMSVDRDDFPKNCGLRGHHAGTFAFDMETHAWSRVSHAPMPVPPKMLCSDELNFSIGVAVDEFGGAGMCMHTIGRGGKRRKAFDFEPMGLGDLVVRGRPALGNPDRHYQQHEVLYMGAGRFCLVTLSTNKPYRSGVYDRGHPDRPRLLVTMDVFELEGRASGGVRMVPLWRRTCRLAQHQLIRNELELELRGAAYYAGRTDENETSENSSSDSDAVAFGN